MKTTNFFEGKDDSGVKINIGIRSDGKEFFRQYRWNGYVTCWSSWRPLSDQSYSITFANLVGSTKVLRLPIENERHIKVVDKKILRRYKKP